jgi:uncharacterized protein
MALLQSFVLSSSEHQNEYVQDLEKKQTLLCHPILRFFLELHQHNQEPSAWVAKVKDKPLVINGSGPWTREDIEYYYTKFQLLRDNGYFGEMDLAPTFTPNLSPEHVRQALANNRRITFEITDRCNLCCHYCGYGKFYNDYDPRENKNLDAQAARTLLDYMCNYWNSRDNVNESQNIFVSFYGGEPLLNFDFIRDMVTYCHSLPLKRNRIKFLITTNGVLLNQYLNFLMAEDFIIVVSLDGDAVNNSYRRFPNGRSSHDIIVRHLERLRQDHPEFYRNNINFNTVLHNRNSVESVVEYFKNYFDKLPHISSLNTMGIRKDKRQEFMRAYKNFNESLSESCHCEELESELFSQSPRTNSLDTLLHECSDFCFTDYNAAAYGHQNQRRYPTATCIPFSRKIFLTVNGRIMPCEKIGFQYGLGQVSPKTVELDFTKIADQYNAYYDKFRSQCQACYNHRTCGKCMFFNDLSSENMTCDEFHNNRQYAHNLGINLTYFEDHPEIYSRLINAIPEAQDD